MNTPIETHPLAPFIPKNARLLLLGSFPPPRSRWKMDFYYPNLQNDMWRIFGLIYHGDRKHFLAADGKGFREIALREFLAKHGIAISDTACSVRRLQGNAADKSLDIVTTRDIAALLKQLPACTTLATTGALATTTLIEQCPAGTPVPRIGSSIAITLAERSLQLYRLPSTSRAYPLKLENKAAVYRDCLVTCGLLK
jgi:G:T/U mismatch-specific DNA glycosylase